ncbi:MAG: aminoacyl-tRNA hydrolase [Spirochaetaceae bacterium]
MGLGNPGPRFDGTRHNVGFAVVEHAALAVGARLRRRVFHPYRCAHVPAGPEASALTLAQPLTYMNRSGDAMRGLLRLSGASVGRTLVICDNVDLEPGRLRMKCGGGTAGHRGLASVVDALGSGEFLRLYVGVGRPEDGDVVGHVLGRPEAEERERYEQAFSRGADSVLALRRRTPEQVMNEVNRPIQ